MSTVPASTTAAPAAATFARDWQQWHRDHETRRADAHGFLAITGLHWLGDEATRIPGVPGSWSSGAGGPVVQLGDGETLQVDGVAVAGRHAFGPIPERGGVSVGFDGGVLEVARRGGRDLVRPRRPDFPFLAAYAGTDAYAPEERWRVEARYTAFPEPRPHEVGAAVDGLVHVYDAPGFLEFAWEGRTHRLIAFPGHGAGSLLVLFTDETSGVTTYAANRTVIVPAPDAEGRTVIDFTRAVNLPCAYTDFATCPLPPAENRLPFAVEAGEKTPSARVAGVVTAAGIVSAPAA